MHLLIGLLTIFSFLFFTGCSGPEGASSEIGSDNVASDNVASDNGSDPTPTNPNQPADPNPVPPTDPNQPTPGDIVAASEPDPQGSYPPLGQSIEPAPDPFVEPNSDYIVPVIGITAQPAPYIGGNSGTIVLQAADNTGGSGLRAIECSIDGGAYSPCGNTVTLDNLSEGLHTITALATDWDDNVSSEVSYTFYVDQTPPTIAISKAPNAATKDVSAAFEFQSTDLGSGVSTYQCRINNGTIQRCNRAELFENLEEGTQRMDVRVVDNVGNQSVTESYEWVVDLSPPVIDVTKQPGPIVYIDDPDPVLNFNVIDQYSPTSVATTCTLNGQAFNCRQAADFVIPANQPASYTLVITSVDTLGNKATKTINWQSVNEAQNRSTSLMVGEVRPVDILFVVDNSGSMSFERSSLAQRIDGMINVIDGLDWQIAVTSTDVTTRDAKSDGRFIELIGMPGQYILDSSMDPAEAQSVFGKTVQKFGGGSGREEGIYASQRVVERYVAGDAQHQLFIRENSDLAIVVLSDEDESSNGQDTRTTPQGFLDYVNGVFMNKKNVVFHSIITIPGDSTCLNGEGASYGNTYDALSRLTGYGEVGGAIIGSVCQRDYTSQLADIGQSVKDLKNSIQLDCPPFDADKDGNPEVTVSYRADANKAYAPYNAPRSINGDRVVFNDLLPPGDYKADYKCKIN